MPSKVFPKVIEVRRTDTSATYLWDHAPRAFDRKRAERDDPPERRRVGHCWPGDSQDHAPIWHAPEDVW